METMVIMTEKMALQQHSEKIQQLLEYHAIELNQVIKKTLTVHLKNPAPTQQRSFSLKSLSMKKPNWIFYLSVFAEIFLSGEYWQLSPVPEP